MSGRGKSPSRRQPRVFTKSGSVYKAVVNAQGAGKAVGDDC